MPRCKHIPQDPSVPGSCLAACIESYLVENNKPHPTQKEMLDQAKAQGLCGEKDFVLEHNVEKFGALFGIDLKKLKDRQIPHEIPNNEGVLIGSYNYKNTGQWHCVRFFEHVADTKFRVMDPAASRPQDVYLEMETSEIDDWKCDVYSIRLTDP
jgi:hypothetical protein